MSLNLTRNVGFAGKQSVTCSSRGTWLGIQSRPISCLMTKTVLNRESRTIQAGMGDTAPLLDQNQRWSTPKVKGKPSALPPCPPRVDNADVDAILDDLQGKKAEWAALPLSQKIKLLQAVRDRMKDYINSYAKAASDIRGLCNSQSDVTYEMLLPQILVGNYITKLEHSLATLQQTGRLPQRPVRELPGGQLAVQVYPFTWRDKLNPLTQGLQAELYLQPGAAPSQGASLKETANGEVAVVLMPGNYGALGLRDLLATMFEYNAVAVLKYHPMWEGAAWARISEYILAPLAPYFRSVYADHATTAYLARHPLVEHVHMTGGTPTHDILAWGSTPEEQRKRKAANDPLIKAKFTSELGCVTPLLVAPGEWTKEEIAWYSGCIVEAAFNNVSCNCNSVKVVVLPGDWEQCDQLLAKMKRIMQRMPLKPAFYPGIQDRYNKWKAHYPKAEAIHTPPIESSRAFEGEPLPWLLNVMDRLPEDPKKEYAFQVEPFAPVLTVVKLPSKGLEDYLRQAVAFANDSLWGSLSANLLVDSRTEAQHKDAVAKAVQDLRYGSVSINNWAATVYITTPATWGAYAGGQTLHDIGSGSGPYGNPLMYDHIQKTVVRTPWNSWITQQPAFKKPLPLAVAKALCGLLCAGLWGLIYALMFAK